MAIGWYFACSKCTEKYHLAIMKIMAGLLIASERILDWIKWMRLMLNHLSVYILWAWCQLETSQPNRSNVIHHFRVIPLKLSREPFDHTPFVSWISKKCSAFSLDSHPPESCEWPLIEIYVSRGKSPGQLLKRADDWFACISFNFTWTIYWPENVYFN